jgi:predicted enzyme involved in methoxymalonyl-ACP biosynthesis
MNQVIVQFVMSCRVAGLTVELFILQKLFHLTGGEQLMMRFIDTGKNAPFRYFIAPYSPIDHGVVVVRNDLPDLGYVRDVS